MDILAFLHLLMAAVVAVRTVAVRGVRSDDLTYRYLYAGLYAVVMFQGGYRAAAPAGSM